MKPIDILGLKNFRIFDDKNGFLEEFSSINILTGANNSGKSSIVKALQMLRNSIKESKYPFILDLNQQEHLLGDFDNMLFNKANRKVEITLPFLFLGIKSFYISLTFEVSNSKNTYKARLRRIDITDKTDKEILFSFHYREATDAEKDADKVAFEKELLDYNKEKNTNIGSARHLFLFSPFENQLNGYIEWRINLEKLKHYLSELRMLYEDYLNDKEQWTRDNLEYVDNVAKDTYIIPSSFINSFKKDADIEKWENFIDNKITNQQSCGKEKVGERDFEADDFFITPPEIENILFSTASEVLRKNLPWRDLDTEDSKYSIIEHNFNKSWEGLLQRISTINYVSNIKEENARSYNATSNSPFINLLKNYASADFVNTNFIVKYLNAFEIGKKISVEFNPKYQSILVSITTLDGTQRELVDFGYGIKQLILILMQINFLAQENERLEQVYNHEGEYLQNRYNPSLLVIEEPESNLHPKWQSLLADMFVEANEKFNIQLIIETHSEYLIRKFQTLVADNGIEAQNVKIFYLRSLQKVTKHKKQVESLFIQEDGSIDFNIFDDGFFDENYKLELSLLNIQRDKFFNDFEDLKNSHLENEAKIIELQQKIDDFTSKANVIAYEQIINQKFDVTKLSPISVKYLVSGQFLLQHINDTGDFSPVIIQYGRAIENELNEKLFLNVNSSKKWMLGKMQGSLEKQRIGTTSINDICNNTELSQLSSELQIAFTDPTNLRIDLLEHLRSTRNDAGHAGLTKSKQDALNYIQIANDFLDKWIGEKK